MRGSRCIFNTAAALHRVFVLPVEQAQPCAARHGSSFPHLVIRTAPKFLSSQQRRCFVNPRPAGTSPAKSRLPRDQEITASTVSLVNTDGKLQEPRSTRAILDSLDLKTYSLVVVVPGQPGVPPICKIVDKKKEWASQKAKKKQQNNSGATPTKTMELNWAIERGDLGHRLARLKEFLEKGWKVEIVLAAKRKGKKANEEEAEALLKRIREVIADADAKETKMEGKLLGIVTMFTEGKAVKKN